MKIKPFEKIIAHCNSCRAALRVGRKTDPNNYESAAASKGWQWLNHQSGQFVSATCRKCLRKESTNAQGRLAL